MDIDRIQIFVFLYPSGFGCHRFNGLPETALPERSTTAPFADGGIYPAFAG
jgi:hypothetical protein